MYVVASMYFRFVFQYQDGYFNPVSLVAFIEKVFFVNLYHTENVFSSFKNILFGNSLAVQWLGLSASTAGSTGSISGWGTKIPHAGRPKKKFCLQRFISVKVFNNSSHLTPSIIHVSLPSLYIFLFCWYQYSIRVIREN